LPTPNDFLSYITTSRGDRAASGAAAIAVALSLSERSIARESFRIRYGPKIGATFPKRNVPPNIGRAKVLIDIVKQHRV
jgi:hypothetical protein